MIDHRELLRNLRLRPGMYLGTSDLPYDRLVTYVLGHREFFAWQQAQSWHNPDLKRFYSSPPPELINVEATADLLGITRSEVFDLVVRGELRLLRSGSEIFFRRTEVERGG